ncbi:MAG: xylose isomerase, partial [Puniceicoccales bacterium]
RLEMITDYAKEKQDASGVKLLWGTANLFSNPRYMNGAGTNPDFGTVAYAGAQLKNAIDATIKLGGENYVFWGGREGYMSLLNTNMKQELDNFGAFLGMARDYARAQGFKGNFFIEPKPMEPSKHQYDVDAHTVVGFLNKYGLADDFKLNVEVNHATLAGHTFQHELQVAADNGMLGSIDANRGDPLIGWDTDQFPTDIYQTTQVMLVVLGMGGFTTGGLNFDAKRRRESHEPLDLIHAHIGGMDTFARGLKIADAIRRDGRLAEIVQQRYAGFGDELGRRIESGQCSFDELERFALANGEPALDSGRQEMLENLINEFI